ncbi:MAG: hypothetical protein JXA07_12875, partial [Spirochaetes bacterium]|nr:hypothetical protein [Spirochaetota bacterium]
CAVEDLRTNRVVRLVGPTAGSYAFVWEGALPWWFLVREVPAQRVSYFNVKVSIPGLESLKQDYYHAWFPLRAAYRIDTAAFSDPTLLSDGGRGADDLLERLFGNGLRRELQPLLSPFYQRDLLLTKAESTIDAVRRVVEKECEAVGIRLSAAALTGPVIAPEIMVYNEGRLHAAELRRMDRGIEMEVIESRSRAEKNRLLNEQFYAKLNEISKIISANPDILKYIYIDKLGGNVNVILSSDNRLVPPLFDTDSEAGKGKSREIDNFK